MNIKNVAIFVFLFFGLISKNSYSADINNYAMAVIADEFLVFANNNKSENLFNENDFFKMLAVDLKVNATVYENTFDQNEVLANQKFKNKTILFNGKIKSIDVDMMGNPSITFVAGNNFSGVIAKFSKSQSDSLAELQKGKTLSLICKGDGKLMYPSLKDCKFPFQYALENKNLEKFLADALKRKIVVSEQTGKNLAMVFTIADMAKGIPACSVNSKDQGFNKKCASQMTAIATGKEKEAEMKARFDDYYKAMKVSD